MRLLVLSDSHGNWDTTLAILNHEPHDYAIHLGDAEVSKDQVESAFDLFVAGNHDNFLPVSAEFKSGSIKGLAVHGHLHYGIIRAVYSGNGYNTNNDLILFGHMHVPIFKKINGKFYVCPGAVTQPRSAHGPTYAIIDIDGQSIHVIFKSALNYQVVNVT